MKLEDQVCSLELAKQLKKLGVEQDSLYFWTCDLLKESNNYVRLAASEADPTDKFYSAFTVAELGELLPRWIYTSGYKISVDSEFDVTTGAESLTEEQEVACSMAMLNAGDTEADRRAGALTYLLENKLVTL